MQPTTSRPALFRPKDSWVKRLLDVGIAALLILFLSPLLIVVSLWVMLTSPGPVLYKQKRIGRNGRPFSIFKFRTMRQDADRCGPSVTASDDDRITPVGRILRDNKIDELPQLFNVVRGEMSLVGPRPEPLRYVAQYDERQRLRLIVKPGLTGPAQVAGRGWLDFEQRLILELEYIQHYSLRKDFSIICRTIGIVLSGLGAF